MRRSFKLITVLGIPVEINISWFIIFGLVTYTLSAGYFPAAAPGFSPALYLIMGVIAAFLLFICLLLHELSHSFVAQRNNLPISGITLFIFGGVAHMEKEPGTPGVEFKMAAAGPIMSLLLGAFFYLVSMVLYNFGVSKAIYSITDYLVFLNCAVAVFNLLPGFPLDGGRLFRAVVWHFSGDLRRATLIASAIGKALAGLMIFLGLLVLLTGNLLSGLWFIFLGFFLMEAADTSYRQLRMKKILSSIKVKDIMSKNVVTVPGSLTLDKLIEDYFFKFRYAGFPVVEDDTILGIITFHGIKEVDKNNWPALTAKQAAIPIKEDILTNAEEDLMSAMSKIVNNGV
ncbi:MAG: site-2 protease family protein, partial [Candidatus Margulisiibacteriota bacterium]